MNEIRMLIAMLGMLGCYLEIKDINWNKEVSVYESLLFLYVSNNAESDGSFCVFDFADWLDEHIGHHDIHKINNMVNYLLYSKKIKKDKNNATVYITTKKFKKFI